MDQDISFQFPMAFASAALTTYFQVPYKCTLRNLRGIVQADPGDGETITVTTEDTVGGTAVALGLMTFGTTILAGAVGVWVADADYGDTVIGSGEFLKFVTATGSIAVCDLNIELDPYAR